MHLAAVLAVSLCTAGEVETGSLLFLENSDKVVDAVTKSAINHVAIIVQLGGRPWVYEATPPRVRRVALAEYCKELARENIGKDEKVRAWLMRPVDPYDSRQTSRMKSYLDDQLDRRYSVRGYVRHQEGDGIHCAELTANMLARCGKIDFDQCYDESPSSLLIKVQSAYSAKREVRLPTIAREGTWCQRMRSRWLTFSSWCNWSCREAWSFCF